MLVWIAAFALFATVCLGCGAAAHTSETPSGASPKSRKPTVDGRAHVPEQSTPLATSTDYVVASGLRWLIVFDVASVLAGVKRTAPELLPQNNVEAFARSVGIEVRSLTGVSIAGFDYSTLFVARGVDNQSLAYDRFASRLATAPRVSDIGSGKLYTGVFDEDVQHFAHLDHTTTLWAEGDPTTAKAALLLAQRQLQHSRAALHGAALSALPEHCRRGTVVSFVPGPIELPPDTDPDASLVLAATLALSLGATLEGEVLALHLCWQGDWLADGLERTKTLLDALMASRFATLLDLTAEERAGTFEQTNELVEVTYRWSAAKVLKRAHGVLGLELNTLLSPAGGADGSTGEIGP